MVESTTVVDREPMEVQEGSALDFEDVFLEYQRPIYNYLLRLTQNQAEAEDLTQETFIRVYRSLDSFRGDASLSTWIYRIATNVSHDHFRRRATREAAAALSLEEAFPDGEWLEEATSSPDQVAPDAEISACVEKFVRRLPPEYRSVLLLRELQGLKNQEIAEVLDSPLSTVKIRLHRARKKLKEALVTECNIGVDERSVYFCEPEAESEEDCR